MVAEPDRASTAPFRANRDYRTIFQAPNPTTKSRNKKRENRFDFLLFPSLSVLFVCFDKPWSYTVVDAFTSHVGMYVPSTFIVQRVQQC